MLSRSLCSGTVRVPLLRSSHFGGSSLSSVQLNSGSSILSSCSNFAPASKALFSVATEAEQKQQQQKKKDSVPQLHRTKVTHELWKSRLTQLQVCSRWTIRMTFSSTHHLSSSEWSETGWSELGGCSRDPDEDALGVSERNRGMFVVMFHSQCFTWLSVAFACISCLLHRMRIWENNTSVPLDTSGSVDCSKTSVIRYKI